MTLNLLRAAPAFAAALGLFVAAPAWADSMQPGPDLNGDGVPDGPALWRVSDADTTVYVFPAPGFAFPGADWRRPQIDEALSRSRRVFVDFYAGKTEAEQAQTEALMFELGLADEDRPLSALLSTRTREKMKRFLNESGMSVENVDGFKPWFALLFFTILHDQRIGASDTGPKNTLESEIERQGKRIRYFEVGDTLVPRLAAISELEGVVALDDFFETLETDPTLNKKLYDEWTRGEAEILDRELEKTKKLLPESFEALFTYSTNLVVDNLSDILSEQSGEIFVLIGDLAHAGEDPFFEQLQRAGFSVERL